MNQHSSTKATLRETLRSVRDMLANGDITEARETLDWFWRLWATAPASTRRRWKCGR